MVKGHRYAVVMAGGQGTRFWPLSRGRRPKQVLKIFNNNSLLQLTVQRILPIFGKQNVLVVTVRDQFPEVYKQLRFLPKENFLLEPQGNNTGPCIGLAALELEARDPAAIMTILPADHWIGSPRVFRKTLSSAMTLSANHDTLLTIGIKPRHPETGYGYIVKGKVIRGLRGIRAYQVRAFKEKPHLREAKRLVRSGSLWNSGIFVWKVSTLLAMLQRFAPDIYRGLQRIKNASRRGRVTMPTTHGQRILRKEYKNMPYVSIDHAVMEKAGSRGKVVTLEGIFPWSDLGSWEALHQFLPKDGHGNSAIGKWLGLDVTDCLIHSEDRLVVLLGTHGIMVVDTPDALLVANMSRAQDIREVVRKIERSGEARPFR